MLRAAMEVLSGLLALRSPRDEVPLVSCQATPFNLAYVSGTPALGRYSVPAWMAGPHVQMLLVPTLAWRPSSGFERRPVDLRDGVSAAVDVKSRPDAPPDAPLVLVCHGLGGNGENGAIVRMSDAFAGRGWRTAVCIRRGHDGLSLLPRRHESMPPATKAFPCHCDVEDMRDTVDAVRAMFPDAPMALVGFSAGSNVVARYLGQVRDPRIVAGVSVANGHDIDAVTIELEERRTTSDAILVHYLKSMLRARMHEVRAIAERARVVVDWGAVLASTSVRSFERNLMVPLCGVGSVEEFYAANSSHEWLRRVAVPLLCVCNRDDPIIARHLPDHAVGAALVNPHVVAVVTERGGHLGWFEGWRRSWLPGVVVPFLASAFERHG